MKKVQKLGKVQKLRQLSGSCQEGLPEGSSRAGEGEGPEAGRKRAGRFSDDLGFQSRRNDRTQKLETGCA